MNSFRELNLSNPLLNALDDLGFTQPTPIQEKSFPVVLSGKNVVGIAQTGTGKTLAYMLPLLRELKFSKQVHPRILILVPTRELVLQVVEQVNTYAKYMNVRVMGVYGGTNIKTQALAVAQGMDILVATPGRIYDLAISKAVQLKEIKKLVIDEVDVMLDLGFRFQLTNMFELIPERRQNIMFSATMTDDVEELINDSFIAPVKISIAISGARLETIEQTAYRVPNFHTKANLLSHLLRDKDTFQKVLVFVTGKKNADLLYDLLEDPYAPEMGIIHTDKSQNNRINAIEDFDSGRNRILIATDVMARGLDLATVSHVVSFDTPNFPENYIHRIGRTGRMEEKGNAILFFTDREEEHKLAIEVLMLHEIAQVEMPEGIEISHQLLPEERAKSGDNKNPHRNAKKDLAGPSFHEKIAKNKKVNLGGSYKREIVLKYTKPKTRGDKFKNNKRK
ncbi:MULTISPECIES: DEAD/DEAH box helicase [unclassified Imperialibacter]|uniref:DEAD/DEAH box helicase n=1 Tax=unclassified Imperialibacter TaxID=2629706 RepID=UPI0012584452|nr:MULTISPECIES: DEAD/DEAH box helicase [unclassified Imperialibacter]CAD5253124.1 ATP-dependent RNA helicase RhlE [Imperialibacter sp. 75]CAD5285054.1 ATP-dependent RNA helicase RhlE [Imperialibacter sp. 89]VVT22984.1 ATP-dependent RNA helicase RhlE [Imperialibacter sp. EC-SDR9]